MIEMQIDEWSIARTVEFIGAYGIDSSCEATKWAGREADGFVRADVVASLWALASQHAGVARLVLTTEGQVWVASGSTLIHGSSGLNVGLALRTMRETPAGPLSAKPLRRQSSPYRQMIWDIAKRLDRVEADRGMLFRTPEMYRMKVSRSRFDVLGGTNLNSFLAAIELAARDGLQVEYSLEPLAEVKGSGPVKGTGQHSVADLFCPRSDSAEIRLNEELWPVRLPVTATISEIALAMQCGESLSGASAERPCKLALYDNGGKQVFTSARDSEGWSMNIHGLQA